MGSIPIWGTMSFYIGLNTPILTNEHLTIIWSNKELNPDFKALQKIVTTLDQGIAYQAFNKVDSFVIPIGQSSRFGLNEDQKVILISPTTFLMQLFYMFRWWHSSHWEFTPHITVTDLPKVLPEKIQITGIYLQVKDG